MKKEVKLITTKQTKSHSVALHCDHGHQQEGFYYIHVRDYNPYFCTYNVHTHVSSYYNAADLFSSIEAKFILNNYTRM